MAFYAFVFGSMTVKFQRGQIPDNDIVTFSIFVNQVDHGHTVGTFNDLVTGATVPGDPMFFLDRMGFWTIGPLRINDGDGVDVIYTGTNVSDLPPDTQGQLEVKLLDVVLGAVVGAAGLGAIGSAIGSALNFLGDPVGKLLGVRPQGPCNGPVFHDAVFFPGSGLAALPYEQLDALAGPDYRGSSFTRSYTDEETHDSTICGHIAETDVTFGVMTFPYVSVWRWTMTKYRARGLTDNRFGRPLSLQDAIVRLRGPSPGQLVSVSALLGLAA
jgi:hypothetical protein